MQTLYTTEVGTILFEAKLPTGAKTYVCSSLSLLMRLNAVPTATVVIGCGTSILNGTDENSTDNNAEDLLETVAKTMGHSTDFIDCAIYENLHGKSMCIFKGCVVAASLVYKAGSMTTRAVRVECMNAACKLYCQPFTAYSNRCAADIVNKILGSPNDVPEGNEAVSSFGMENISSLTDLDLNDFMSEKIAYKDIAAKIAAIVDGIAMLTTRALNVNDPINEGELGSILKVGDYIQSYYVLNYKDLNLANENADDEFNKSLCRYLLAGLKSGSILDTIISTLKSTDYMLNLVPTWDLDDFVLLIRPSLAWDNKETSKIYFSDIAEMSSAFNPLAHINDPEVFVADFTPAIEFGATKEVAGDPISSLVGAFSLDPQMAQWIKLRFSPSSVEYPLRKQLAQNMMHYKWKEYPAPDWLRTSLIVNDVKDKDTLMQETIENQTQWDKEKDPDNKDNPIIKDYNAGERIADLVAKALYTHIHGASATAQLSLLPDLRFGNGPDGFIFEEHIGEVIDIVPKEKSDSHLAMRGMLEGIQFDYSAGLSANCRYTMFLSRVRPYDKDEPSIECPLYVSILAK